VPYERASICRLGEREGDRVVAAARRGCPPNVLRGIGLVWKNEQIDRLMMTTGREPADLISTGHPPGRCQPGGIGAGIGI
jgi:hypothetical protein